MNVLVFGDVHGCVDELEKVLDSVDLDEIDLVVFAGDILDKGPDPLEVVRMVARLSQDIKVILVEGNHEEQHRRWRDQMEKGRRKSASNLTRADEAYEAVRALCKDEIDFLDKAVLYAKLSKNNALAVHGGIPPRMKKLPPSNLKKVDKLPAKQRREAYWMQEIRFVDPSGKPVAKGRERKRDHFWADSYDGRFGTVLFGHSPQGKAELPVVFPHAIALDLGCATGNKLAAAILRPGKPAEFVVAPAAMKYASNPDDEMKIVVLPDTSTPGIWIGYMQEGDRMIPFSEGASPEDAIEDAQLMMGIPAFVSGARSRYDLNEYLKKKPHPFQAPVRGGRLVVLVHKSTRKPGWWQATFFEGEEPIADSESSTWKKLLEHIHMDSVDWSQAAPVRL